MQVSCSSGPALAGTSETTGCGGNGQLHPDSLTPFMFTTAGVTLDFHRERESTRNPGTTYGQPRTKERNGGTYSLIE